jgi:3-deoxy-manno-octulosonate cytidylyltransferase (CMP-KDO synthetase)
VARFSQLPSRLEGLEMLEQLRLLENGIPIQTVRVEYQPLGVDRPADLERAEELLRRAGQAGVAAQC